MGIKGIGSKVKSGQYAGYSIHSGEYGHVYINIDGDPLYLDSNLLAKKPKLLKTKDKLTKTYYYCNITFKDGGESLVKLSEEKYHSVLGEF